MKKILITGGGGFIGYHTTARLLSLGHEVRILDNFTPPVHPTGQPGELPDGVECQIGDVRNAADWGKALSGVDSVIHLAAYQDYLMDFSKFFHVNTVGTSLLYETAVRLKTPLKKVVIASSQSAYGEGRYNCAEHGDFFPAPRSQRQLEKGEWEIRCDKCQKTTQPQPARETDQHPANSYGISKFTQEMIGFTLGRRFDIPTTALRYSIVQGPRQSFTNAYSGICRILCLCAYLKQPAVLYEDGLQFRDYTNIHDVVDGILLALNDHRSDYQAYNVGGGRVYTLLEFAGIVEKVTGRKLRMEIPKKFRLGDTRHIFSDNSKLRVLGWNPHRSAEQSVADYWSWLTNGKHEIRDFNAEALKEMERQGVVQSTR